MNIPEEKEFVEPWMDSLVQKLLEEHYGDRKYSCNGVAENEMFFLDGRKNFLIIAGKRENENCYLIALKEIGREINGGFAAEVYSRNGGNGCRRLYSKSFNDPEYARARSEAAKFARHLRDSEEIFSELR